VDILKGEFTQSAASAPTGGPRGIPSFGEVAPRASELRAVARVALAKLEKDLGAAKAKAKDVATAAHLGDLQAEIKSILSDEKK
jgi:hypothetical protein